MRKIFITILLLISTNLVFAANILIFDETTGELKRYLKSVNTPDYSWRSDVLVNPIIPSGIDYKYLKVDNGLVVEMTQVEKGAIDAAEAQAQEDALLARIDNYNVSNLDLLTALIKRINVRIPSNPITKQEIIDQIKSDLGL